MNMEPINTNAPVVVSKNKGGRPRKPIPVMALEQLVTLKSSVDVALQAIRAAYQVESLVMSTRHPAVRKLATMENNLAIKSAALKLQIKRVSGN